MISLVISTIGAPFLLDSLRSLRTLPSDVIVVVDLVGREASTLDTDYPLAQFEQDLAKQAPSVRVLYNNPPKERWAVMNQCYNLGWSYAYNDYVMFTHDDIDYDSFDEFPMLERFLACGLPTDAYSKQRVVGLVLPEYEVVNQVLIPPHCGVCLTQYVSPVSQIVHKQALEAFGGFDEEFGVWYDAQLQEETQQRDWWYLFLDTPAIRHTSNRTYRLNNWGGDNQWSLGPKWANFDENFKRKYGHAHTRDIDVPVQLF